MTIKRNWPRLRHTSAVTGALFSVLAIMTACSGEAIDPGDIDSCQGALSAVRPSLAAIHEQRIRVWQDFAIDFEPNEKQRKILSDGGALPNVAPLPIVHPNGWVETDPETFARIQSGELNPTRNFKEWLALGLYNPSSAEQRNAAVQFALAEAELNPGACGEDEVGVAEFIDPGMPDAGTTTQPPADPGALDCRVECTITFAHQAKSSNVVNSNPDYCSSFTGEGWHYSLEDKHRISLSTNGGDPKFARWGGPCTCSGHVPPETTSTLKISVTASCQQAGNQCPANLKWELMGVGSAKQSVAASATGVKSLSDTLGCAATPWQAYAKGGARCGASGADWAMYPAKAEIMASCQSTQTAGGGVEWSQEKGWAVSGSVGGSVSCAVNLGLRAHATADCNVDPGTDVLLSSRDKPAGAGTVWAGVGGASFESYAKSVHDRPGGAINSGAQLESEVSVLTGGHVRTTVKPCHAWDKDTAAIIPCTTVNTIHTPAGGQNTWAAETW